MILAAKGSCRGQRDHLGDTIRVVMDVWLRVNGGAARGEYVICAVVHRIYKEAGQAKDRNFCMVVWAVEIGGSGFLWSVEGNF
ncbi:hypothetical protein RYX36_026107 [Vicia faba]